MSERPVKRITLDPALDPATAQHQARLAAAEAERAGYTPVIEPFVEVPDIHGDEPQSWSVAPPGTRLGGGDRQGDSMMANRQALDDATVERLTYAEDATVALLAGEVLRLRQTVLRMLVADDEPDEDERQLAVARQGRAGTARRP